MRVTARERVAEVTWPRGDVFLQITELLHSFTAEPVSSSCTCLSEEQIWQLQDRKPNQHRTTKSHWESVGVGRYLRLRYLRLRGGTVLWG